MDITTDFRKLARWTDAPTEAKPVSDFMQEAIDVLESLRKISTLLRSQRKCYVDPARFLPSKAAAFSDVEREELEESVLESYQACELQIEQLKDNIQVGRSKKPQTTRMQMEMVAYLSDRVKRSAQIVQAARKQRITRPFFASQRFLPDSTELHAPEAKPKSTASPIATPVQDQPRALPSVRHDANEKSSSWAFTEDETEQFRAENIQLHKHLHEEIEAAKRLEASMHEISRIMGHFSDNIEAQHGDLEKIAENADTTSTNVVQGNKSLAKAYDYGENRGFTIFCFYAAASVLLLVMHYY
ncbi:hypothetical protein SPRG_20059 [Saprolegnia parasitica CBS 223.65]|uniref:t-SNARE coiled-coil homology domain-containing protein n=1 Tax=Saprolegnia parasitica (strain CBS 223.65) TaxID=695850 RepID=A0A067CRN3_SAPPC|nr:hypothetical protein SPRG_20059 [Saprolegnia parasitica CBS 223.65]KDO29472.1 hypothetical protein SPRG_20059 [Saprolegnia parasitica CBS 223.65]|eukprot:XP_012200009.1 hypothetical protein SPRG_20059 [Saprolegnia parasitica CBS 223.65]